MKTRVLYLDTSNRKLIWKEALERALSDPPVRRPWWSMARMFLVELFS